MGNTPNKSEKSLNLRQKTEEELFWKTKALEAIFESSPYIMVLVNEEGRITAINRMGIQFSGRSRNELLGLLGGQVFGCVNSNGLQCGKGEACELCPVRSRVMHTFKTGEAVYEGTGRLDVKKGGLSERFDILVSTTLIQNVEGRQVLVTIADITERKKAEEALKESHELLFQYIRQSPLYTYIKEVTPTESRVLQASDNFKEMIGFSGSDMLGKTMTDLFPAEFAAKITADDLSVVANGKMLKLDEDFNGRNYTTLKVPIVIGDRTWLAGYTTDITERRKAEEELKAAYERLEDKIRERTNELQQVNDALIISEARLRATLDQTPNVAIQWYDESGEILYWNPASETVYGWEKSEIIGKKIGETILTPEDAEEFCRIIRGIRNTGKPFGPYETMVKRKDGSIGLVIATIFAIPREDGKMDFSCMDVDITERKELEQKLIISEKMASIGNFTSSLGHEINQPLGAILLTSELLNSSVEKKDYDKVDKCSKMIREQIKRINSMVFSLKTFSNENLEFKYETVDLNEAIKFATSSVMDQIQEKGVDLSLELSEEKPFISGEEVAIERVITNIISNAIWAVESNTDAKKIYVRSFIEKNECIITVADNGKGISKEIEGKIFEPFFTTKEVGKGTGLGLSISYGIMKRHKGSISVGSEIGKGATFRLSFPYKV